MYNPSMKNKKIISQSREAAIVILKKNKNFVHDVNHLLNVERNIIEISENKDDLFALQIATHWHDTGRIDIDSIEKQSHEILSAKNFLSWSKDKQLEDKFVQKVARIIKSHRNRKGFDRKLTESEAMLWDADKLDIINVNRCKKIFLAYKFKKNNEESEFNIKDTLKFWSSINDDFSSKFHSPKAKKIFKNKFPLFKKFINQLIIDNPSN